MIPEVLILHELVMLILTIQFTRANITEVASFQNICNSFLRPKEIALTKISNASSMNVLILQFLRVKRITLFPFVGFVTPTVII